MSRKTQSTFTTIRTEGMLLPAELLQRLMSSSKDLRGLTPNDYHLAPHERINDAVTRAWSRTVGLWQNFSAALDKDPSEHATTLTRERWLLPLFQELGFGRLSLIKPISIEDKVYPLSHCWENTPIHLVGAKVALDRRTARVAGAASSSPHSLLQELLNRAPDLLWGMLSNGLRLRILRDNASLSRQTYLEFDLEAMFNGERYSDFVLLWLLCHQSRFENATPEQPCWLEQWSKEAQQRGTRALDDLRNGVEHAIAALGAGFIKHANNVELRTALRNGSLSTHDYYRQVLRWVYRLLFLCVAEDREVLLAPNATIAAQHAYLNYYSTQWLRTLAQKQRGSKHADLFCALRLVCEKLGHDDGCPELGLPALGGFLFSSSATPNLNACEIANRDLLDAIRALAFTAQGKQRRVVDYKNLGPEELGSVYESLLELHPQLHLETGSFTLNSASGSERKTTGSYYTPTALINCLLDSALEPVIQAKRAANPTKGAEALLSLKICDPACGSGHFLIAAAHRLAKHVAAARSGDDEPAPEAYRSALREVIGHCIYGVDLNPMAVELCKVNLWLEALEPGKPLSFLDAHIQCGNSLLGTTPDLIAQGVPDEAFTPISGDDKAYVSEWKKQNKKQRSQSTLFGNDLRQPWDHLGDLASHLSQLDAASDDTIAEVRAKERRYADLVRNADYLNNRFLADAWCAAFVWRKVPQERGGFAYPITSQTLREIEHNPYSVSAWLRDEVQRLSQQYQFFHWHLAFPELFAPAAPHAATRNGFDVVLGNPPWERIKLQEKEFFAARDPAIADAPNAAARKKQIEALQANDPSLFKAFHEAVRTAEGESHVVRNSGRYPLTAVGDVNTYALFSECARSILNQYGRAGIIVPTGIATDDTTKDFFGDLVKNENLVSLYNFENEAFIFPSVHHAFKFSLLTIGGDLVRVISEFICFIRYLAQMNDSRRQFRLSQKDIALFNPNTRTASVFRTRADAELTRKIYQRVPVLWREDPASNPWGVSFRTMFHMSNDSGLFKTQPADDDVPLYEAKLLHQFDHRWATYAGKDTRDCTEREKADPHFAVTPRYWVSRTEVDKRLGDWKRGWLIGFRDITNATNERTAIFSVLPRVGVGHTAPLIFIETYHKLSSVICFLCNINSIIFDYIVRQKVGGTHLTYSYIKQFPVLPPDRYPPADLDYIVPRVLQLVYTAHDLQPFAADLFAEVGSATWQRWFGVPSLGAPFAWQPEHRAHLRAELDAYYTRLYGLSRDELRYILDPKAVHGDDFPSESFRVLKEREQRDYGEYRTQRLVLEKWDALHGA